LYIFCVVQPAGTFTSRLKEYLIIGINTITNQGIKDRDGNPIRVDKNILSKVLDPKPSTAWQFGNLLMRTQTFNIKIRLGALSPEIINDLYNEYL
jgi:hypothetical protein